MTMIEASGNVFRQPADPRNFIRRGGIGLLDWKPRYSLFLFPFFLFSAMMLSDDRRRRKKEIEIVFIIHYVIFIEVSTLVLVHNRFLSAANI